jgi:hypothetical protein
LCNASFQGAGYKYLTRLFECSLALAAIGLSIASCFLGEQREDFLFGKLMWSEIGLALAGVLIALPRMPKKADMKRSRWVSFLVGLALIYLLHRVVFEQGVFIAFLVNIAIEAIEAYQPISQYEIGSGSLYEGLEPLTLRRFARLRSSCLCGTFSLAFAIACYFRCLRQWAQGRWETRSVGWLIAVLFASLFCAYHLALEALPAYSPTTLESYAYVSRRVWIHYFLLAAMGATWLARQLPGSDELLDVRCYRFYHRQRWFLLFPIVFWWFQFFQSLIYIAGDGRLYLNWDNVADVLLTRSLLSTLLAANCLLLLVKSKKDRRLLRIVAGTNVPEVRYFLAVALGTILMCCAAPILLVLEFTLTHHWWSMAL